MRAFKLYIESPIRIGEAGIGLEGADIILHSDTLFGALARALVKLNEDVVEFKSKVESGEICFSSCFPFTGETYFLPPPQIPTDKKWNFLDLESFEKVISGEKPEETEKIDFIEKVEIPKVALDRTSSNSSIYYLTAVKFEKDSGLYFLMKGKNGMVKKALKFLGDEGIGGKKTWGLGKFRLEEGDISIKDKGNQYLTLSLTYPTSLWSIVYWKPVIRSGWVNSKNGILRKPKIMMASEGSIFSEAEEGEVIDLDVAFTGFSSRVGHKVYVNGKSFLIRTVV